MRDVDFYEEQPFTFLSWWVFAIVPPVIVGQYLFMRSGALLPAVAAGGAWQGVRCAWTLTVYQRRDIAIVAVVAGVAGALQALLLLIVPLWLYEVYVLNVAVEGEVLAVQYLLGLITAVTTVVSALIGAAVLNTLYRRIQTPQP